MMKHDSVEKYEYAWIMSMQFRNFISLHFYTGEDLKPHPKGCYVSNPHWYRSLGD
jgi:hypothetical protein